MSAATDGFSAMMSFLAMPRERPQMIIAKDGPLQPPPSYARACARTRGYLVRQAAVRRAEQVLGQELAGGRLLVPEDHEHDQLQLVERERVARGGERALEHQLARLRGQNARVLERDEKAAAFGVQLGEPVQRLADVGILEAGRRKLARDALAVIGQLGLLAVLEQVDQDIVHSAPFL